MLLNCKEEEEEWKLLGTKVPKILGSVVIKTNRKQSLKINQRDEFGIHKQNLSQLPQFLTKYD